MKRNIEGKRRKRIPKKRWLNSIENDKKAVGVCVCRRCRKLRQVEV
jgi:hypothetical protein